MSIISKILGANIITPIAERISGKKADEEKIISYTGLDVKSARELSQSIGQGSNLIIFLRHSVRILGGHLAQGIFFFNIIAPHFGMIKVNLTSQDYGIIFCIITYFYGSRFFELKRGRK